MLCEVAIVYERGPRGDRAGDHDAARLEPAVAGGDDRNEHSFVDPETTQPLRDDHIDTFRQLEVQHVAVDHVHDVRDTIRSSQLLREGGDRRSLDGVDTRGAGARREHAQDAASRTDVENGVAWAHYLFDGPLEGLGANTVADHRPVHLDLRVHRVGRVPNRRPHSRIVGCQRVVSSCEWRQPGSGRPNG